MFAKSNMVLNDIESEFLPELLMTAIFSTLSIVSSLKRSKGGSSKLIDEYSDIV